AFSEPKRKFSDNPLFQLIWLLPPLIRDCPEDRSVSGFLRWLEGLSSGRALRAGGRTAAGGNGPARRARGWAGSGRVAVEAMGPSVFEPAGFRRLGTSTAGCRAEAPAVRLPETRRVDRRGDQWPVAVSRREGCHGAAGAPGPLRSRKPL